MTRLTGARRVEPFGWSVVVGVPVAENTNAGQSIIALAATWAVTLMASILIGFWAVGRFTNPLRKLAASASSLGEGQLHERVEVETEDEVGALAQNFNVMAAQLETKFKELQTQGAFIEEVLGWSAARRRRARSEPDRAQSQPDFRAFRRARCRKRLRAAGSTKRRRGWPS